MSQKWCRTRRGPSRPGGPEAGSPCLPRPLSTLPFLPTCGSSRGHVWGAEQWIVGPCLSSWILLCVWDCTGREGWREGIPHAVNNQTNLHPGHWAVIFSLCLAYLWARVILLWHKQDCNEPAKGFSLNISFCGRKTSYLHWATLLFSLAGRQYTSLVPRKWGLFLFNCSPQVFFNLVRAASIPFKCFVWRVPATGAAPKNTSISCHL